MSIAAVFVCDRCEREEATEGAIPEGWSDISEDEENHEVCKECTSDLRAWLAAGPTVEDQGRRNFRTSEPPTETRVVSIVPTVASMPLGMPPTDFVEGERQTIVACSPREFTIRRLVVPSTLAGLGFSIEAIEFNGWRHLIDAPVEMFSEVGIAVPFDFEVPADAPIFVTVRRAPVKVTFRGLIMGDVKL